MRSADTLLIPFVMGYSLGTGRPDLCCPRSLGDIRESQWMLGIQFERDAQARLENLPTLEFSVLKSVAEN